MRTEWQLKIKEEVTKQLKLWFIKPVHQVEWIDNIVPIKKKEGKNVHKFRYLNKACPKDDFPLPHVDVLMDNTAGNVLMSFMDGFLATDQRMAIALLHDMMHNEVEVYVDDMIVKYKDRGGHIINLRKFFERIKKYRLRLNPQKCTFGVTTGKLLGFLVSDRGIDVDPSKIKAILDMLPPKSEKEIRGFLG